MTYTSTVSTKGQVTIPEAIRAHLKIKPGDTATFSITPRDANRSTITITKNRSLEELAGCLHIPGMKYIPIDEAREMAADELAKTEWLDRGLILKK